MTTATHRPPARWTAMARAESAALWRPKTTLITLGVIILATLGPFGAEIRNLAVLMCFFPLLHRRGRAGRGSLEQALPVQGARYDLIRVACGAAGAAFTLALTTGLNVLNMHGWYVRMGGYPASYPFALIAAGMAFYLADVPAWVWLSLPMATLLITAWAPSSPCSPAVPCWRGSASPSFCRLHFWRWT